MSRRRISADKVDRLFVALYMHCPEGHYIGLITRQLGTDKISLPMRRVDGPNGETKVQSTCEACAASGRRFDSQIRWERLAAELDKLDRKDPNNYRRHMHFP